MKIGLIVCSYTGNTLSTAEAVKVKLTAAGHEAVIEKVVSEGEPGPGSKDLRIVESPDVSGYDGLVFAAPVMAFSLAPVMKKYMENLPSLEGKTIAVFVTKQLKFNWTGGNRAVSQMKKWCIDKGGDFSGSGIVIWSSKTLKEDIDFIADEISSLYR